MILSQIIADPADAANTKLAGTAKTFKNTKKLIAAVNELEKELREGEYDYYRAVAELLTEAQAQMAQFQQYVAMPHVALIKKKIEAIESELRRQIQWSFREIGQLTSSEHYEHEDSSAASDWNVDVSPLSDVCQAIDALGEKFRFDLLERFAQLQLIPYEKLFKAGTKYAGLDGLEQRFAWFRYLLRLVDSRLSDVFPSKYKVGYHLFIEFARRTKKHLGDVLAYTEREYNPSTMSEEDNTAHVGMLLKTIKTIITFETEIYTMYDIKPQTAPAEGSEKVGKELVQESIRDAFDSYLGPYVQLEKRGLEELMASVMKEEDDFISTPPAPASNPAGSPGAPPLINYVQIAQEPFESSRKLFEYIKGSLKRCMVFSTGMTFLSLSKEFRLALQQYAESLKFRCPPPRVPAKNKQPAVYVLNKMSEATLCRIIGTCEYCVDTLPSLENLMRSKIQTQYMNEIDFNPQVDSFTDTVSYTMNILALGEVNRMEKCFIQMKSINWATFEGINDTSIFVTQMFKILADCVPKIRNCMSQSYFLNMCMKLSTTLIDAFHESVYGCKRIGKEGAGQLLLDLNAIKENLLVMPNVRTPEGKEKLGISKTYLSVVNTKLKKVENVLKLLSTEEEILSEMFGLLWPDATQQDMDSINTLRGNRIILSTINNVVAPLDTVGDMIKDKTQAMHKGTVQGFSTGINKVKGGLKNAFGDFMSGNLFNDSSTHSGTAELSSHASNHDAPPSATTQGKGLKQAVTGVTSALNFGTKPRNSVGTSAGAGLGPNKK